MPRAALWLTVLAASRAWAHGDDAFAHWTADPFVLPPLLVSGALYARGAWVLWRGRDVVHGLRPWQAVSFGAGWMTVALALLSPLERWSDALFSAHMGQHELLILVAAPLVVMGRPLVTFLWAFPLERRRALVAWVRTPRVLATWRVVAHPLFIVTAHALALWGWHVPVLFEAALESQPVHALQHASFFFTAVLFFQSLVFGRYGRLGYGVAVAYVFITALHSSLLGAFFTFAQRVWYPLYAQRSPDALEDQRLAGLLMWVPAGVLLTGIALALFLAWLGAAERAVGPAQVETLSTPPGPKTRTGP